MTSNVALLVNPTAGKGRAALVIANVVATLRDAGMNVEVIIGRDANEALTLARDAVTGGSVDGVVALGGDGMVHLALQAVAQTDTPLGVVPAGTGNDLAAALGLPLRDTSAAAGVVADLLVRGRTRPMDAVRVGDTWFGCVLGAGFDSKVNDRANRLSWPRGRMRYNLAILAELRVFTPLPFRIELDGDVIETDAMLVAVGNAKSYGAGMKVCPGAEIDDGLLDVTILGPVSKPEFLRVFPRVYRGTHITHPAVTTRRAKVVSLASPGVTAYADGEYLADLPITCECVPGAVRVVAP